MRPEQNGVDYIMNITSEMLVYEGSITESAAATYTEDDIILPVNQFSDQGVIIYGFEVGSAEPQDLPAAGDTVEAIVVGLYTSSQTDTVGIENQETIARTLFKKLGDGTDWLFFFEEREGIPHKGTVSDHNYKTLENKIHVGIKSTNASAGATAGYRIYLKTVEYTDSEAKALLYAKTYED